MSNRPSSPNSKSKIEDFKVGDVVVADERWRAWEDSGCSITAGEKYIVLDIWTNDDDDKSTEIVILDDRWISVTLYLIMADSWWFHKV